MKELKNRFQQNVETLQKEVIIWFKTKKPRNFLWREFIFIDNEYVMLNEKKIERRYAIFIAEFFLIRTKAEQVELTYKEFLQKYPSFKNIYQASDDEISSLLEPLGLKRRVKQLKKISKQFTKRDIPNNLESILKIEGIGLYSGSAFLCFSDKQKLPLVDSNFVRIYCRIFGIEEKSEIRRKRAFINFCESILPETQFWEFNLGILDLGALICKSSPECTACPLTSICQFYFFRSYLDKDLEVIAVPFFDKNGQKMIIKQILKKLYEKKDLKIVFKDKEIKEELINKYDIKMPYLKQISVLQDTSLNLYIFNGVEFISLVRIETNGIEVNLWEKSDELQNPKMSIENSF